MKPYRNAERTKKWIRRAFTELMAEKKDIEKISVTELAERADISKTTFYYHYEDIYAVAEEFENELIDALSAALKEIGKSAAAQPLNIEEYTHGIFSQSQRGELPHGHGRFLSPAVRGQTEKDHRPENRGKRRLSPVQQ